MIWFENQILKGGVAQERELIAKISAFTAVHYYKKYIWGNMPQKVATCHHKGAIFDSHNFKAVFDFYFLPKFEI